MEEELSNEAKELVDSYVALEDESNGCDVVKDVEAPMVVDDNEKEVVDHVNLELSRYLVGGIVEPELGMEFNCEDDARNYYNAYAKQTGFSIRVNSYYRSKKDNLIISREFCCSKEGFRRGKRARSTDSEDDTKKRRARPITREGCKALMTVRRRDNGKWYVAKLEKNHSHELVTPAMRHFLRSHKQEYEPNNSSSSSFSSSGLGLTAPSSVLSEDCNSLRKMGFSEAIKCAEEGMTSDHSFKVALNALREARMKIAGAKKNAMNASQLETMASTSCQDENTIIASQVDSSAAVVVPPEDQQNAKRGESCTENSSL
ncbi:hypothetical protein JRO89_XS12G0228800 [Xanthoceras sorbifolium]|uniref:FAR1 domain-containing protein n=1 Tax=Xanthoceras sorbifolium TaxID=99658 RepID=A0ABQ8HDG1_9ROSI|nr:hypothetical protein JRO89_XS12G0228800 [Xanthoceras sorbifolium]